MPIGQGRGMGRGLNGTFINAPTMAYITVYGHNPSPPIMGREAQHETKNVNGIPIDIHIPDKPIKELMNIKMIESRASCEGDSERHVTFFIFRPVIQKPDYVEALCKNLKAKGLKCHYDIGAGNQYRICVAEKLWYDDKNKVKFLKWWNDLPGKIKAALVKTSTEMKV